MSVFGSYSKLIAPGLGLSVTVLAARQAFLRYEKRAAVPYKVGGQYGVLR
jgi:DNA-binding transcriptional MocR family regulator